jgi:hypothetical protein
MKIGDTVLFLEGREQMRFTATATVARVTPIQSGGAEEAKLTQVELEGVAALPEGLDLDTFRYSLTIVRNTVKPYVHFRRGYRLLPHEDFETIEKGEPFIARSGYFDLLSALPRSLRAAFEAEQILLGEEGRTRVRFRDRLERLYAFIDRRVLAVGRLLSELAEVLSQVELDRAPMEHWFVSEGDGIREGLVSQPDDLFSQLLRFAGLWEVLVGEDGDRAQVEERDIVSDAMRVLDLPDRRPIEARFERLFAAAA